MTCLFREIARSKETSPSPREVSSFEAYCRSETEHNFLQLLVVTTGLRRFVARHRYQCTAFARQCARCFAIDAIHWTPPQINDQMELAGGGFKWRPGCS